MMVSNWNLLFQRLIFQVNHVMLNFGAVYQVPCIHRPGCPDPRRDWDAEQGKMLMLIFNNLLPNWNNGKDDFWGVL